MKFNTSQFLFLSLLSLILVPQISQAQNSPRRPGNVKNTNVNTANDWSQFTKIQTDFMQGCVGQQNPDPAKLKIKESFCLCALEAYKSRYSPQVFSQIDALATLAGKNGPTLVNLMMKPELDRCSVKTKYIP